MSTTTLSIFKTWVPEWLIRITIFLVLLPALGIFALYFSNANETIGYYAMEPGDVQYSVVIMYAALVAFLPVDARFVKFLMPRKYFLIGITLNTATYLICAGTKNISLFMACRFVQGLVCALFCSICLNLIFTRLHSTRARVIGYTIFYGLLQVSIPACAIFCSWLLQYYEFSALFYALIIIEIPGIILFLWITNNVRFIKKFPLYQVDWVSYVFYTLACSGIGYFFIYGQQLNWFESPIIFRVTIGSLTVLFLFVIRQLYLKRPLVDLRLFKYVNFRYGLLLLVLYYIFKGTTGYAYIYLQTVLGLGSIHLIPIWFANILGTILGMFLSSRFILYGTPIKNILIAGFTCLLLYHIQIYFLFSSVSSSNDFMLPLFVQGIGAGSLFVPIVLFTVSSVPVAVSNHASFIGISLRFVGFCIGVAINNYYQLFNKSVHYNTFREGINDLNPVLNQRISEIQQNVILNGQDNLTAKSMSSGILNKFVGQQVSLRSSMDYYTMMIYALAVLVLILIVAPYTKKIVLRYRRNFIPY
ncbi:MFS transporter [Flavobacterium sp. '19STA2R22 D10 B1']|uniref:MFS transporter n=1 Tax=Flavobacterium aerium TaxID=3037261 RepID=UPI00278BBD34|nr:MFS transporter [Flavobacterium sp. '19STA2R22 D10 B1']